MSRFNPDRVNLVETITVTIPRDSVVLFAATVEQVRAWQRKSEKKRDECDYGSAVYLMHDARAGAYASVLALLSEPTP